MLRVLELEESFDSGITDTLTLSRFKNSPNSVSLLSMPFALNCMMVNECVMDVVFFVCIMMRVVV